MDKIKKRCLGVMVVYEQERSFRALERFERLLADRFSDANVCVISNNPQIRAQYIGSNRCGEFSAWAEVLERIDMNQWDLVLFGNDTFDTRRVFSALDEERLIKTISVAFSKEQPFLVGERCWHIDYRLMRYRKEFLIRWMRTNLFALSSDAIQKLDKVFLDEGSLNSMIEINREGDFSLSSCMPEVIRTRIEAWLKPQDPSSGWHGVKSAPKEVLALKVKCVTQEIYLSRRCEREKISLCATQASTLREDLLSALYVLQTVVLSGFRKKNWTCL